MGDCVAETCMQNLVFFIFFLYFMNIKKIYWKIVSFILLQFLCQVDVDVMTSVQRLSLFKSTSIMENSVIVHGWADRRRSTTCVHPDICPDANWHQLFRAARHLQTRAA